MANGAAEAPAPPPVPPPTCALFDDLSGKGVIATLTLGAFLAYVGTFAVQRCRGRAQRSWKVFWLDLTKMGVGQFFAWLVNVANAERNSERDFDAVSWYLPTFINDEAIAVPLGVLLWHGGLRLTRRLGRHCPRTLCLQALESSGRYHAVMAPASTPLLLSPASSDFSHVPLPFAVDEPAHRLYRLTPAEALRGAGDGLVGGQFAREHSHGLLDDGALAAPLHSPVHGNSPVHSSVAITHSSVRGCPERGTATARLAADSSSLFGRGSGLDERALVRGGPRGCVSGCSADGTPTTTVGLCAGGGGGCCCCLCVGAAADDEGGGRRRVGCCSEDAGEPHARLDFWGVQLVCWVGCVLVSRLLGGLCVPLLALTWGDASPYYCLARAIHLLPWSCDAKRWCFAGVLRVVVDVLQLAFVDFFNRFRRRAPPPPLALPDAWKPVGVLDHTSVAPSPPMV